MIKWEEAIAIAKKEKSSYLELDCEGIQDISVLSSLSSLKGLDLSGCGKVKDFSPLKSLSNLRAVSLEGARKIDFLSSMRELTDLALTNCFHVSDLTSLSTLNKLQRLAIDECSKVKHLDVLSSLSNLQELKISYCKGISDLSVLSQLICLKHLKLEGCDGIKDAAPLSSLINLENLDLSYCGHIKEVSFLSNLKQLKHLTLSCEKITDISALLSLPNLKDLNLFFCYRVNDFSSLCHLSSLEADRLYLPLGKQIEEVLPSSSVVSIHKDEQGRLHNEKGPAISCKEGLKLYHWHGAAIPGEWIEKGPPSAKEALRLIDIEQRRAACEIIGWEKIVQELGADVIDKDTDPGIGVLLEAKMPRIGKARFLKVRCATGRYFVLPVPPNMKTAHEANAWTWGLKASQYHPEVRT